MYQKQYVEEFVFREREFGQFWSILRGQEEKYRPCVVPDFSFENTPIRATFRFTLFFLEIFGSVNTTFQERFCSVVRLWDIVVSLKRMIDSFIHKKPSLFNWT